jgi:hypothetical protein
MHPRIVNNYLVIERLHEISNADLDLLCNSLDLDKTSYMCVLLLFSVCSNGTKSDKRLEGPWVVETTTMALGTESSMLSFGWAMVDRGFIAGANGFYYDPEGVRYRRSGEEGQNTYEQVTSILQGGLDNDRVPSPLEDAMVTRVLDYMNTDTPQSCGNLKAEEEVETQSSQAIA